MRGIRDVKHYYYQAAKAYSVIWEAKCFSDQAAKREIVGHKHPSTSKKSYSVKVKQFWDVESVSNQVAYKLE